ncbi:MAG: thioredoxin domain-containing protein [Candidatus Falkowbacteria bacterium]
MKIIKKNPLLFAIVIIIALSLVVIFFLLAPQKASGNMTDFAHCLKDKKAAFYGAFWCSHCQKTKAMFGASAKYLPYVECSTPDSQGQTDVCRLKGIVGYPTWIFADGSQLKGEVSLAQLEAKTGCVLGQ